MRVHKIGFYTVFSLALFLGELFILESRYVRGMFVKFVDSTDYSKTRTFSKVLMFLIFMTIYYA